MKIRLLFLCLLLPLLSFSQYEDDINVFPIFDKVRELRFYLEANKDLKKNLSAKTQILDSISHKSGKYYKYHYNEKGELISIKYYEADSDTLNKIILEEESIFKWNNDGNLELFEFFKHSPTYYSYPHRLSFEYEKDSDNPERVSKVIMSNYQSNGSVYVDTEHLTYTYENDKLVLCNIVNISDKEKRGYHKYTYKNNVLIQYDGYMESNSYIYNSLTVEYRETGKIKSYNKILGGGAYNERKSYNSEGQIVSYNESYPLDFSRRYTEEKEYFYKNNKLDSLCMGTTVIELKYMNFIRGKRRAYKYSYLDDKKITTLYIQETNDEEFKLSSKVQRTVIYDDKGQQLEAKRLDLLNNELISKKIYSYTGDSLATYRYHYKDELFESKDFSYDNNMNPTEKVYYEKYAEEYKRYKTEYDLSVSIDEVIFPESKFIVHNNPKLHSSYTKSTTLEGLDDTDNECQYHYKSFTPKLDTVESKECYNIYPNPTSAYISINGENNDSAYSVNIYDCNGKKLGNYNCMGKASIDTQGLQSGIYCVEIIDNRGTYRHKLVVQ
ncbi:MAG: T9SS type A sorting domain-containing protein [Hyphomicrobiales bacterium]